MYFVYIIYSPKLDKYYIGFTADISDRLAKHNSKSKGFSNLGKPWQLVYYKSFDTKQEAMSREKKLKPTHNTKTGPTAAGLVCLKTKANLPDLKNTGKLIFCP